MESRAGLEPALVCTILYAYSDPKLSFTPVHLPI